MKTTFVVLVSCLACHSLLAADAAPLGTPLFEAIRAGDSGAVQDLLKHGADLHTRNDIGDTPLMAAAHLEAYPA